MLNSVRVTSTELLAFNWKQCFIKNILLLHVLQINITITRGTKIIYVNYSILLANVHTIILLFGILAVNFKVYRMIRTL